MRLSPTLSRLFDLPVAQVNPAVTAMILCHDIGKLTRRWQENMHDLKSKRKNPPHATLGAPYLLGLTVDTVPLDVANAAGIAIMMHHVDSGLARNDLECPAEDAINHGLSWYGTETIDWYDGASETLLAAAESVPEWHSQAQGVPLATTATITTLADSALRFRQWSRCPRELERHARRLRCLALHHVLRICDWRAASQRGGWEEGDEDNDSVRWSVLNVLKDGGLLV